MKSSFYRDKWSMLVQGPVEAEALNRLSRQIGYAFMDAYLKNRHYEKDYIELLCEMTTFWKESALNNIAAQALFQIIIESLCDEFEDLQTETYNKVMSQVISYCRKLPSGKALDRCLQGFDIYREDDLIQRINEIRSDGKSLSDRRHIKKIILLSRVTIGADVAITSIIIQRLAQLFPGAEMILIGGSKLKEIYGGNPRLNIKNVSYNRRGGLLERLSSWHQTLQIVRREIASDSPANFILVDPDSRLSQLGVLPLVALEHYYFFDSRSELSLSSRMSMAELTNAWLDELTAVQDFRYPKIWLLPAIVQKATEFCQQLRNKGTQNIIAVNFGVGGNPRKKLGDPLEQKLLLTLLQEPNTVILLDKGFGKEEHRCTDRLLKGVRAGGYAVQELDFSDDICPEINQGIVGLQTRIGEIAAVIANSDEYIGYDSACQHIAAAVKTPCLTIFAGSNNMRFIRRWSAFGPDRCQIVHVDTLTDPRSIDVDDIITRIRNARRM